MSRLAMYQDDQRVGEHILMRAVVSLGRHPDNDIVLNDLSLSRFHARIERRGDRYVVVDLGSQNGVFLNGVRISGESTIRPGDRIGLGRYVGVFNEGAERRVREAERKPARPKAKESGSGPVLILEHHGVETDRYPLQDEGVVIGRSQRCDVVISLLALSRRHARVRQTDDGSWTVEDLGSQNGTYLNDRMITSPTCLQEGDVLNFFEYTLVFKEGARRAPVPDQKRKKKKKKKKKSKGAGKKKAARDDPGAEAFDDLAESLGVSEVIELSAADVEELSPDFGLPPETRADRSFAPSEATSEDLPGASSQVARVLKSWPSAADSAVALAASQRSAAGGRIEVLVDGRVVTEVPLALGVVRIGSDARCDVALPPMAGIAPWHLLVTAIGEAVLMMRIGDAPAPRIGKRAVYQAFLLPGDRVDLGRAAIVYHA